MATALGYKSAPGYYRFEQEDTQGDRDLPMDLVERLVPLLRGRGNPAITLDEILVLAGIGNKQAALAQAVKRSVDTAVKHAEFVVETEGGKVLPVRYRLSPGVYVDVTAAATSMGISMIGVSPEYPAASQFAAMIMDDMPGLPRGTQLHCVSRDEFGRTAGRTLLVATQHAASSLVTYAMKRDEDIASNDTIVGVVVGRYTRS